MEGDVIVLDCNLKDIGRDTHICPIKINAHAHKDDELVYYISGEGLTRIWDTDYPYSGSMFAFYPAGTQHDGIKLGPCDVIWLQFSFCIDGINLKEGLFSDPHGKLLSLMKKLKILSLEKSKYSDKFTEICLAKTIVTASELQNVSDYVNSDINCQKVLDNIDDNNTSHVDFVKLAAENGYSYDRFRHLFKEHFGFSPYSYLMSTRINHAKQLLTKSSLRITEIAYSCGFNSSSQFANLFKKYTNNTPIEYRNKYKNVPQQNI